MAAADDEGASDELMLLLAHNSTPVVLLTHTDSLARHDHSCVYAAALNLAAGCRWSKPGHHYFTHQ